MQKRNINIFVGCFVLLGFIAFIMLSIRVSGLGLKDIKSKETYNLTCYFDNIGSLKSGAAVSLAGVEIGYVDLIELDKKSYNAKVHLVIDKNIDNIPIDSSAAVVTAGILGQKYITIGVGAEIDYLKDGDIFEDTQSALIIEDLIGKYLIGSINSK